MSRILLKLSGEALSGKSEGTLYDQSVLQDMVAAVRSLCAAHNEVMIVLGGGNLFRGATLSSQLQLERSTADYIGMLATIQNALVVRDYFLANGIDARVASAIAMPQVCEAYIPKRIARHMEKGRVIIFAAGLGVPYFTTDTTAVQRALELAATEVIFVKNGIDALYDADPRLHSDAKRIVKISATDVVREGLRALDLSAVALARDNKLSLRVIGMSDLSRALDTTIGSIITPE
ncbi:MAG TPA: UMP kinase [Candidatus Paceibacterota bacterium]|nr:UMP kinase [Candidatus Paceibacterota bacterium]